MHVALTSLDIYLQSFSCSLLNTCNLFGVFIVKTVGFRCNISTIMLEMDRILRPGGLVYIRDSLAVIGELEIIGKALGWRVLIRDTSEGPHASYKILHCDKPL